METAKVGFAGAGGFVVARLSQKGLKMVFPSSTFVANTPELGDLASIILFLALTRGTVRMAGYAGAGASLVLNLAKRANIGWETWGG